jgi:hypothetical protein
MRTRWALLLALGLPLCGPVSPRAGEPKQPKPSAEVEKARKHVEEQLTKLKANNPHVEWLDEKALTAAFPGWHFFAVRFRQWPVAVAPPQGLKSGNVFVVSKFAEPISLSDAEGLENFFKKDLPLLKNTAASEDAVKAWLTLSRELVQDGYYQFYPVAIVESRAKGGGSRPIWVWKITAATGVKAGGSGRIRATQEFDENGKLKGIDSKADVRPGPRPRCHATLLLHLDPLVRQIVEDDLLIMGRAAREYLWEQRARADPELQRAIDRLWQRILQENR